MKKGNEKKEPKSKTKNPNTEGKEVGIAANKPPFKPINSYVWNGDLKQIKKDAAKIIGSNMKIGRIYTIDGTVVNSIDQVNKNDVLVAVKLGDTFKKENEKVVVLAEKIKAEQNKTQTIMKESQIDKLNYFVAMSKTPIEVARYLAMLSTFANCNENEQNEIENKNDFIQKIILVQQQYFYKQLVDQGIAPQKADIPFQDELTQWSASVLEKVDFDNIHFAIYGQRFSGKTMVLNSIASTYYRKLALAGINGTFLPFPIDFASNSIILDDEIQAYQLFVRIAFESLRYSCPQILPIYDFLFNWFKGLPDSLSTKPIPPVAGCIKGINVAKLQEMGRSLISAFTYKDVTKSSMKISKRTVIYEAITRFPCDLCKAFGLKHVIFIIDHADQCNEDLAKALISVLDKNLYIMASQVDSDFFSTFQLKSITPLYSDGIIKGEPAHRKLLIDSGTFLSEKDCSGCPGYLTAFYDMYNLVVEYKKLPAAKKFRKFKTAADISKEMEVKKKIILFLDILKESGNKKITTELLEKLSEQKAPVRIEVLDEKIQKPDEEKPKPSDEEPKPNDEEPNQNEEKPNQNKGKPKPNDEKPKQNEEKSNKNKGKPKPNDEKPKQNERKQKPNKEKSKSNEPSDSEDDEMPETNDSSTDDPPSKNPKASGDTDKKQQSPTKGSLSDGYFDDDSSSSNKRKQIPPPSSSDESSDEDNVPPARTMESSSEDDKPSIRKQSSRKQESSSDDDNDIPIKPKGKGSKRKSAIRFSGSDSD